jgi:hypothetical protein
MSDAAGGRTTDRRPCGLRGALPAASVRRLPWPLPLRRALAERFPAHIDGGRFAPLVHRSRTDRERNMR